MSKEMICPVCQHKLYKTASEPATYCCLNKDCPSDFKFAGSKEIWQILIQSQRDLQTAVQALKDIRKEMDNDYMPDFAVISEALKALKQIEHKE